MSTMAKRLESWQEIADHLGVTVRSAQRWEQERGLPVTRLSGNKGRVSADPRDLDRWRERALHGPSWWSSLVFFRYYAVATTALLLIGLGMWLNSYLAGHKKGPPSGLRVDYRTLIVTDSAGRELWRQTFPQPLQAEHYAGLSTMRRIWFGDLDGDRSIETLFVYYPTTRETESTPLLCFDSEGAVRWSYKTERVVSDQTRTFLPIYHISDFRVEDIDGDGELEILLTSHQLDSHPNQFAVLGPDGRIEAEYWHSGQLPSMVTADIDGDGTTEVLLGGINNGRRAAEVVILDADNIHGASRQPEGDPFQLRDFNEATERAVIVFPRSCINQRLEEYNLVTWVTASEHMIRVKVAERRTDGQRMVIYTLNENLEVTRIRWADLLKDLHREMESRGELDHTLTEEEIEAMKRVTILR